MKSLQEAFDTIVNHLATQNEQCSQDEVGCAYRGSSEHEEEHMKCAVGCLIKDEFYDKSFEGNVISNSEALQRAVDSSGFPTNLKALELYSEMQRVHDTNVFYVGNDSAVRWMDRIAETNGLTFDSSVLGINV